MVIGTRTYGTALQFIVALPNDTVAPAIVEQTEVTGHGCILPPTDPGTTEWQWVYPTD